MMVLFLFFTFIEDLLCISKADVKKMNDIVPRNFEYNSERGFIHTQDLHARNKEEERQDLVRLWWWCVDSRER